MIELQKRNIKPDEDQTAADNRGKRAGKGSGEVTGSGADAGGSGNPEDYDNDPVAGGGSFPPAGPPPGTGRDGSEGGMR